MGRPATDLTGRRFGKLTVIRRHGSVRAGTSLTPTWVVRCDCGTEKVIRAGNMRSGYSKSFGCVKPGRPTHGMYGTPENIAWGSMLYRCTNPRAPNFANYGGRGITVCDRWRASFETFLADMGPRPSPRHSLDRIDVNGNYGPSNCRWATSVEQASNKRNNHVMTVDGRSETIAEWARTTGLLVSTIRERIRRGWDASRAVMTQPKR